MPLHLSHQAFKKSGSAVIAISRALTSRVAVVEPTVDSAGLLLRRVVDISSFDVEQTRIFVDLCLIGRACCAKNFSCGLSSPSIWGAIQQ